MDEATSYLNRSGAADVVESLNASSPDFVNQAEIGRRFMEPEDRVTDKLFNRNLNLGNIRREDLAVMEFQWNNAMLIKSIPDENGKFLFSWIGDHIIQNVNFKLVASNSVDAKGRMSVISRVLRSFTKDETPKGGIGAMLGRNGEQR